MLKILHIASDCPSVAESTSSCIFYHCSLNSAYIRSSSQKYKPLPNGWKIMRLNRSALFLTFPSENGIGRMELHAIPFPGCCIMRLVGQLTAGDPWWLQRRNGDDSGRITSFSFERTFIRSVHTHPRWSESSTEIFRGICLIKTLPRKDIFTSQTDKLLHLVCSLCAMV